LGAGISAAVAAVGLAFAEPLLRAMHVAPEVLAVGAPYLRLSFLLGFGFVFGMLVNGVLNGAGDSTTPMVLTVIQVSISLLAEWLLIFGHAGLPALGVRGAALGVAVGQGVGITLALRVLLRGGTRVHLRPAHLRPAPALLGRIVRLAWPPALQMIGGFLVTVFFLRLVGDFGPKAQAAYSIGLRLGMVGPMLAFPLAGAAATLVGQNLGAGRVRRAWASLGVGLAVHAPLLWSVAAVLYVFRTPIVAAFAGDPEVIRLGAELLRYQAGTFAAFGLYFVFLRGLQGAGDVAVPMVLSLGNSVFFTLPLGVWLATEAGLGWGPEGVFMASMVGAFAVTAMTGAWLATGRWARRAPRRTAAAGSGDPVGA
ncbi:MAG: MATE family efflux transporter, partial [Myxococcota bacterium]|nr:MATE family efflux transporter [Myxococcota bacterium]